MEKRIVKIVEKISTQGLDGLLITDQKNIYYLSGFWGSAGMLFISKNRRLFVTDDRYALIAQQTVKDWEILITRQSLAEIAKVIAGGGVQKIGFEDQVSYGFYQALQVAFADYELVATSQLVEQLRWIKDETELAIIRQACQISDQAFVDSLDFIKPGKTELEVANFLDFRMRELGATGVSFETIAASGPRSAMPHGVASSKVIQSGESLTLDFGCVFEHYISDMTRTIHIGHVTDEERAIYDIVLRANQAVIDQARAGMPLVEYDRIARAIIEEAGYGDKFSHGIGHGMGLDVHEQPYFRGEGVLQAGMVVTDEPGIYLDGKYGLRIEDDLLITKTGCEVLTHAPKELIVI